jgi:hypothetical protein
MAESPVGCGGVYAKPEDPDVCRIRSPMRNPTPLADATPRFVNSDVIGPALPGATDIAVARAYLSASERGTVDNVVMQPTT